MTYKELFPYSTRPIQDRIMEEIWSAMESSGHVVIEAGTGSGKTVSALAPTLAYAYSSRKRVLYLTRTNSQQRQVIVEFRRIKEGYSGSVSPSDEGDVDPGDRTVLDNILDELNDPEKVRNPASEEGADPPPGSPWDGGLSRGVSVGMQGRNNMCPVTSEDPDFMTGTPEELSQMCSERKKHTANRMSGRPSGGKECPYYSAFMLDDGREARDWSAENAPTAEEMVEFCLGIGICPYEVNKLQLRDSVLVTAPYIYFFSPFIRRRLLEWMNCELDDLIVIVDEAHNLSQFIREMSSVSLSKNGIGLALSELETYKDHEVSSGVFISTFLRRCMDGLDNIAGEYLIDDDGLVPPSSLREELMLLMHTNSSRLDNIASEVLQHGAAIQDQKKALGKLPRSYLHSVAHFYMVWESLEFEKYTPLIVGGRRDDEYSLEAFAMDPSILTGILNEVHSSVHLSGTLSPMEEYRDSIGIPEDTPLVKLPPPFPRNNRILLHHRDLSTNYERLMKDPDLIEKYRSALGQILYSTRKRNTAVFFPSFNLMSKIMGSAELEDGETLAPTLPTDRKLFIERRGSKGVDLLDLVEEFKDSEGGILASVLGGRLSEGIDYPGRSLEQVIIVGIPYPKPNARQRALSAYYDIKFHKGWEYTVHAPTSRRLLQAIGRMIRSESDRGAGYILDRRAIHFKKELEDLREGKDDLSDLAGFFGDR